MLAPNLCMLICLIVTHSTTAEENDKSIFSKKHEHLLSKLDKYHLVRPYRSTPDGDFLTHDLSTAYEDDVFDFHQVRRQAERRRRRRAVFGENYLEDAEMLEQKVFHFSMEAFGTRFTINVTRDKELVSPTFEVYRYLPNGSVVIEKPQMNCFYRGNLIGSDPSSAVAVSNCRGMSGLIKTFEEEYFIEPLELVGTQSETYKYTGNGLIHIMYRSRDAQRNTGTEATPGTIDLHNDVMRSSAQLRRRKVFLGPLTLKMMKNRFKKGKHRKFQDDWEKSHEPVVEGVTFFVKYLGVEIVNLPNDETHTSEAIKKIIHRAKYGSGKVRKVALTVTPTSLKPTDLETNEELEEIVIHRISYCTADKNNDKIFGFISCHFRTEVLECHAYLCQKRKVAEALALTVAQAFNLAFDVWKKSRVEKTSTGSEEKDESTSDDCGELSDTGSPHRKSAPQAIPGCDSTSNGSRTQNYWSSDASTPSLQPPPMSVCNKILTVQCDTVISSSAPPSTVTFEKHRPQPLVFNSHIHLEDSNKHAHQVANSFSHLGVEDDPDLDDCFSKLAESRSNPGLLDINVRRSQFDADVIVHFSGTNMDRDTLLKSQSKDSFFLPESQDNLIVGDL